jgi:hypothetical protein
MSEDLRAGHKADLSVFVVGCDRWFVDPATTIASQAAKEPRIGEIRPGLGLM